MRPAILNPLFAGAAAIKGIGRKLDKTLAKLLRPGAEETGETARIADLLFHLDAVEPADDGEHPFDHLVEWKVRPQLFFVEIVAGLAKLFGIIANIPRLQLRSVSAFQFAAKLFQILVFANKERLRAAV